MKKLFQLAAILILLTSCKEPQKQKTENTAEKNTGNITKLYSKFVNDTFLISVSLPNNYNSKKKMYPVVYLLDANLYFDIVAATFKKYSEVGLLPQAILIGIGYKDFKTMDSLRTRDLTYPVAIPEYEMSLSGKADAFLSFIETELNSKIERKYSIDTTARVLMGHSLGGYFTMYALQQNLIRKNNFFSGYIAASPSTHYNHNFILKELDKLTCDFKNTKKVFVAFGGQEDDEENEGDLKPLKTNEILLSLSKSLKEKNKINYKGEVYSNLGHMDTGFPTFVKGLQWVLNKEDSKNEN